MPYKYTDLPCVYIYIYVSKDSEVWDRYFLPRLNLPGSPLKEVKPVHVHAANPPSPAIWEHGQNAAGSAAGNLDQIIIRWVFFWRFPTWKNIPIGSMYGVFRYIYHQNQPNVGMYTIHGSYGIANHHCFDSQHFWETQKTTTKRRNRKKLGKKRYLTNNHGRRVCFGAKNVYVG